MKRHYRHTQNGRFVKWIMGATIALCLLIAGINGWSSPVAFPLYGVTLVLMFVTWLFSSLTIEIDDEEFCHFFGSGFWKKRYLRSDIESVKHVQNRWVYGWGIRLTPHGWLYNISGFDAVEVKFRSGKKIRVGTDDPEGVLDLLNADKN